MSAYDCKQNTINDLDEGIESTPPVSSGVTPNEVGC